MTSIDYECESCGIWHRGTDGTAEHPWPVIDAMAPDALWDMQPWERAQRVHFTEEVCLVATEGEPDCYLSSHLTVPVREEEAELIYRVWVKIALDDYLELMDRWEDPLWHTVFDGTLASELPGYDMTRPFALHARMRGRAAPELLPAPEESRALAVDVRQGISRQEAELRIRSFLLGDLEGRAR